MPDEDTSTPGEQPSDAELAAPDAATDDADSLPEDDLEATGLDADGHGAPEADGIVVSPLVLRDLRRQRRKRRLAGIEWFDALYRAYLTGGIGIVVVLFLSSAVGAEQVTASGLHDVERYAPAAIGVLAALAIGIGLRSGSRGGPLALERAEVRYVLLAPVDRRRALLAPALRQARFVTFVGAVTGAIAGQLAGRRLPGAPVPWALSGALAGALIGIAGIGAGFLACGWRLPRWVATIIAGLIVAWSVADLVGPVPSPFAAVGHLAIWPLGLVWWALLAIPAAVVLLALGLSRLGRLSLEAAERRTALVGQLRFAATVRDLRTVMVLRRQLIQEQHRTRPWWVLRNHPHSTIWRRDLHGILRFPLVRLIRMAALTAIAAVALNIAYHDAVPAVIVAAFALYLVGLDAIEPLSQEVDQADSSDSIPMERGVLLVHHLFAPAILLAGFAVLGGGVAYAINRTGTALAVIAVSALPAVWAAGAGAVISVAGEEAEPSMSNTNQILPPEVAGMRLMFRTVWPVVVCTVGTLPVLAARGADSSDRSPVSGAVQGAMGVLLLVALTGLWLRYRQEIKAWWRQTLSEGQQESKRRAAERTKVQS